MKEIRQAVVLGVLACGLVFASACGSDDDSSGAGQSGGGGSAGKGGSGQAGHGGSGHAGGIARGGAAGAQGEVGGSENGGAFGLAGAAGAFSEPGDNTAGSAGAGGSAAVIGGDPTLKIVFVTSTRYSGDFGGVTGADAKCQERALAVNLAGTYKAWISGHDLASSPSVRFVHSSVPYRLLDGSMIASDWADLTDGTLRHAINLSETSTTLSFFAFTFTLADGTPGLAGSSTKTCYTGNNCNCDDWTNGNQQGSPTPGSAVGQDYGVDSKWTDYSFGNFCGDGSVDGLSLYCFEQ